MKHTLTRKVKVDNTELVIEFQHWPATYDTRTQPGDSAEVNVLTIKDIAGNPLTVPDYEDDGGNGEYEKICKILLDELADEEDAMSTIAIEPWD